METIGRARSAAQAQAVVFDFDGTLSLIRSGWADLMVGMMLDVLTPLSPGESGEVLRAAIEDLVLPLTGKETRFQMIAFGEEVVRRGGRRRDPDADTDAFLQRLFQISEARKAELRAGGAGDKYLVPGARRFLERMQARGLRLYLASGTDETALREEARLLDVDRYFEGGIYGAGAGTFAKRDVVDRILSQPGALPEHLLAFGDGAIEIEEVRRGGGITVGVATDEPQCLRVENGKRKRLIAAGAEYIVANFLDEEIVPRLFRQDTFDRSRLTVRLLAGRVHDLQASHWMQLNGAAPEFTHPDLPAVGQRLIAARESGAARILMMGAHVLRAGVSRHLINLMERGFISHIAVNGAGAIHDYELARIGATTESVERYIKTGEFGLWRETGELNDWTSEAARFDAGMGETIARKLAESNFEWRDLSVFAAAWRCGTPVTVHVGIGYDILHEHPNCDGAALGAASYCDFLIFAKTVERLEGGVVLSFGSRVMAPEVYLKALAMARNVAEGKPRKFTTAVFDLVDLGGDVRKEPAKTDPGYYFRPHKTMLVRTVADGGESFYFQGDHRATVPALWRALTGK
ncbi:MAG TPA: HAD family hydrolase [Candidatus Limnocylindrales bacterium]|nr:HAD family hydrolase [Candidatus Limnocylindrales bacterium]